MDTADLEQITLELDEAFSLELNVSVNGTNKGPSVVRLCLESGDCSFVFNGKKSLSEANDYKFDIPAMLKHDVAAGTYEAKVEVIVENRYFVPAKFELKFEEAVRVVVSESAKPKVKKQVESAKPTVTVTQKPGSLRAIYERRKTST